LTAFEDEKLEAEAEQTADAVERQDLAQVATELEADFKKLQSMLNPIRSVTLQRFFFCYINSTAGMVFWLRRHAANYPERVRKRMKNDRPKAYPGIKAIMAEMGCSERTARDFQRAFDIIGLANRVEDEAFRISMRLSSKREARLRKMAETDPALKKALKEAGK